MIYNFYWKKAVSNIVDRLNKITQTLNSRTIAQYAYQQFVKHTPIRSGNARNNTVLQGNSIICNYSYSEVLDKGRGYRDGQMRGSEQSPEGMTKPTIEDVREMVLQKTGMRLRGY